MDPPTPEPASSPAAEDQAGPSSGAGSAQLIQLSLADLQILLDGKSNKTVEQETDLTASDGNITSDEEEEVDDEVNNKVAAYVNDKMTLGMSQQKLESKFKRAKRPKNVMAKDVKINKVLYKSIPEASRKRDMGLRKINSTVGKAVNNLSKVASWLHNTKAGHKISEEELKQLHMQLFDGLGLICNASWQINIKRVSYIYLAILSSKLILKIGDVDENRSIVEL